MTNLRKIENKVEKTLASIDHATRAKANPFLYTRIMASLKREEKGPWGLASSFINRPAIALAAILVVLIMNSLVFFQSSETNQQPVMQEEDQIFASEYNYPQTTADRFYSVNEEQQ
jgi:Na+/proline symporter